MPVRHAYQTGALFLWGGILEQPAHLMHALQAYKAGYALGESERIGKERSA